MDFNRACYLRLSNLDCCIQKLGSSSGVCGIAYPSQEMLHVILEIVQFILIEITKDFAWGLRIPFRIEISVRLQQSNFLVRISTCILLYLVPLQLPSGFQSPGKAPRHISDVRQLPARALRRISIAC